MPDLQLPGSFQTFEWFILGLRIAFIFLVYYFLYQIARITIRELVSIGTVTSHPETPRRHMADPSSSLEMVDPAESSWSAGETFPLSHYSTIGRHEDNNIEIDDDFVSGSHAEIFYDDGIWWLQDLGSTNGTFLNSQRVGTRIRLSDGDIVQFGRVRVRTRL